MSEPTTAAERMAFKRAELERARDLVCDERVAAAAEAERARIRAAVEGLREGWHAQDVSRAAVLAAIDGETK